MPGSTHQDFGVDIDALRNAREATGLSQMGLAAELGLSDDAILRAEGGHVPRASTQRLIAARLGLNVNELFPRQGPPPSLLRGLRDERRLTLTEAAAKIDVSRQVLHRAENNERVQLGVRRRISAFYDVPISFWYRPNEQVAA